MMDAPLLAGKHILLGVTGGVATYRVAELARALVKQGAQVRCVMTASAQRFVSPLTFETLTGEKVYTQLFDLLDSSNIGHIQLARWADVVLVAPATANTIAKYVHGIADDLLSTLLQANTSPLVVAPAMNTAMWESVAVQRNIQAIQQQGVAVVMPDAGLLACGEEGVGRLASLDAMQYALECVLSGSILQGQYWVINAGATQEFWDATRMLTNPASGMLGAAMARIAAAMGAQVTLIAAPNVPDAPHEVERISVCSAQEMLDACVQAVQRCACDVFVATAAVSDYAFVEPVQGKLKRGVADIAHVRLRENADVVASIASMDARPRMVVGFAAETEQHVQHGQEKMRRKGLDALLANDVGNMAQHEAAGWWLTGESVDVLPRMKKTAFAYALVQRIAKVLRANEDGKGEN